MKPLVSAWPPDASLPKGRSLHPAPAPGRSSCSGPARSPNVNNKSIGSFGIDNFVVRRIPKCTVVKQNDKKLRSFKFLRCD
jgi:hypothetical protein